MTKATLITGDGVGPDLAEAAQRCMTAAGASLDWNQCEAGLDVMEREGSPLPKETLASLEQTQVALKAPITTPVGSGIDSINVHLRQHFDLYACVRPCKSYPGVPTPFNNVDLVVVRENTEGLYSGIEYQQGAQETLELIAHINTSNDAPVATDAALSIKPVSAAATERIVRFAFEYARTHGRQKVTSVHKANILTASDGLWLDVSRAVAKDYPDIAFEDCLVDNLCMKLMRRPECYDVLVSPNLYGDIVSDLAAGLVGGLGMAPSAHVGDTHAVFEAVHGGVAKYKGQNKVNPAALTLSGVMLLRHLGMADEAHRLEEAIAAVIAKGEHVTFDLKSDRSDENAVGTEEMADAIVAQLSALA